MQPGRHRPAKHAALLRPRIVVGLALTRNHQHEFGTVGLGLRKKPQQTEMGRALGEAVQVEPGVDRQNSPRQAASRSPVEK